MNLINKILKESEYQENLFSPRRIKSREENNKKELEKLFLQYTKKCIKEKGKYSNRTHISYFSKEGYHLFSYDTKTKIFEYDVWLWYYKLTVQNSASDKSLLELAKDLVVLIKKYLHIDLTDYTYRKNKLNESEDLVSNSDDLFKPRRIEDRLQKEKENQRNIFLSIVNNSDEVKTNKYNIYYISYYYKDRTYLFSLNTTSKILGYNFPFWNNKLGLFEEPRYFVNKIMLEFISEYLKMDLSDYKIF